MANKIILKKSSVASKVPLSSDLEIGELAVNLTDKKLYTKDSGGTVVMVGSAAGGGSSVVSDADFTLQDEADTTKQAKFQLSGITTGTTVTYTLPQPPAAATASTLLDIQSTQAISGAKTFTGLNQNIGSSTGATTVNIAYGATASGTTKTVNIGTAGASGSTTNISVGSAVSGATTNVSANGTWTFANAISASVTGNAATATNATTATTANALNTANSYSGVNFTASGSLIVGSSGTYAAGSLYSDANWGMIFRAKQASPAIAQFLWTDSAGAEVARISTAGAFSANSFSGAGTGLTGTAASLSIGGNATTATTANNVSGTVAVANGGTGATTGYKLFESNFTSNINANTNRTAGAYGSYASAATNAPTTSGILYNFASGTDGSGDGGQFWQDYSTNNFYVRKRWGGAWSSWLPLLSSSNYNSYSPSLTGSGASGSWAISVTGSSASCTGNAATATTATNQSGGTVSATSVTTSGAITANGNANYSYQFAHGNWSRLILPAGNNGAATGDAGLYFWISEPAATWTGAGIGRNRRNDSGSFSRVNTALTGQMIHFDEGTGIQFYSQDTAGVNYSPLVLSGNNATVAGTCTATSFAGSGSSLTGIVTSIVAGSGISISGGTGAVTISASAGASPIPAGSTMLFISTAAPTGWTKVTTHDNKALRIVSGTAGSGGSVAFTTAFASGLSAGATTLSTAQIPSHYHGGGYTGYDRPPVTDVESGGQSNRASGDTNSAGGGGSHSHTLPSFAVQYVDAIIATKN